MDKYSFRQLVSKPDAPWKVYKATLTKYEDSDKALATGSSETFFDFC